MLSLKTKPCLRSTSKSAKRASAEAEIRQAIRTAVLTGKFYAVTGGDGRGVIVEKLLDLVNDLLPAPNDRPTTWGIQPKTGEEVERKHSESEPMCCTGF